MYYKLLNVLIHYVYGVIHIFMIIFFIIKKGVYHKSVHFVMFTVGQINIHTLCLWSYTLNNTFILI